MAKKYGPKQYVGKVLKGKKNDDGTVKSDSIVFDMDFNAKKGMFVQLVSPADEIKGYQDAVEAGRMTEDKAIDLIAKCEKKKAHTRFTIIYQEITDN